MSYYTKNVVSIKIYKISFDLYKDYRFFEDVQWRCRLVYDPAGCLKIILDNEESGAIIKEYPGLLYGETAEIDEQCLTSVESREELMLNDVRWSELIEVIKRATRQYTGKSLRIRKDESLMKRILSSLLSHVNRVLMLSEALELDLEELHEMSKCMVAELRAESMCNLIIRRLTKLRSLNTSKVQTEEIHELLDSLESGCAIAEAIVIEGPSNFKNDK